MSFHHSGRRYVGKSHGATPAQGGGPAQQPVTLTPNRCYPSRTLWQLRPDAKGREGGGGNEAPHASSKSADGKAGRLGEPYFQLEQPVTAWMCVRSLSGPCNSRESRGAEGLQPPLFCVPRSCAFCAASAGGTAQNLSPLFLFPRSEQPFYSKASLQRFLSLRCLQLAPMLCSCLGAHGVCFFPLLFPLWAVRPGAELQFICTVIT